MLQGVKLLNSHILYVGLCVYLLKIES